MNKTKKKRKSPAKPKKKACTACGIIKPNTKKYFHVSQGTWLRGKCIPCYRKYTMVRYKADPEGKRKNRETRRRFALAHPEPASEEERRTKKYRDRMRRLKLARKKRMELNGKDAKDLEEALQGTKVEEIRDGTAKENNLLGFSVQTLAANYTLEERTQLYSALCNRLWFFEKEKKPYSMTWRYAGGLVAQKGEDYLHYYCAGGEGTVSTKVETDMQALGWASTEYPKDEDK
jgi:hypothetical protein